MAIMLVGITAAIVAAIAGLVSIYLILINDESNRPW
jgi:hypothetical protein